MIAAALVSVPLARAQGVSAEAEFARETVRPGEIVAYTVTLKGERVPKRFQLTGRPDLSALDVSGDHSFGHSSQFRFINGRSSSEQRTTITWQVSAPREGKFLVEPFSLVVGGQSVEVPQAVLRVTKQAQRSRQRRNDRGRSSGNEDPGHLEMRTDVTSERPWVGQEIIVTDVLEFEGQVRNFKPEGSQFPGFVKQEIAVDRRARGILGKSWNEVPLSRWRLTAISPGKQSLPERAYTLHLDRPFGGGFFGLGAGARRYRRETRSTLLDVRALPANAPESFQGAVGEFHLSASVQENDLTQGDGTTLTISIKGTGSFDTVSAPELRLPDGLKLFDPEVHADVGVDREGFSRGSKLYRYPLLASAPGNHVIEAIQWTYFRPRDGRYVTRRAGPLTLEVAPGGEAPPVVVMAGGSSRAVEVTGEDIHHVRAVWAPGQSLQRRHEALPATWWQLLALGPVVVLLVLSTMQARRWRSSNPRQAVAREAERRAKTRLDEARGALSEGRTAEAVETASRAVSGLVLDRLQERRGEPSPAEVAELAVARSPSSRPSSGCGATPCTRAR